MAEKTVDRRLSDAEVAKIDTRNFAFRLKVELGPALFNNRMPANLTNGALLEALDEQGAHWKSFIGPMFQHFAEHMRAVSKDPNAAGDVHIETVYYGCGSCTTSGGAEGSTCCDNNGNCTCDAVC